MVKLRNEPFVVFALDGRDGLSSCHQLDGSPAGVQLNHFCQGLLLIYFHTLIYDHFKM